jgi:anthranilate 3-monooxygenase (FAD) / 4-hydroxyphenylacetate 3-monooxygenase
VPEEAAFRAMRDSGVRDAFGSRQFQYERFYAGDPVRILAMTYLGSSDKPYRAMVERALALAGQP